VTQAAAAYATHEEFRALIESSELESVVRDHLIGGIPWYFRDDKLLYARFSDHFVAGLGVVADEVRVIGSARTGFSLSPDAFPRPFHDGSDLDVAVVSPVLFDAAWLSLVRWGHPRRFTLPEIERQWLVERKDEIFWGWLRPETLTFRGLRFPRDLRVVRDVKTAWFTTFRSVGAAFPGTDLATREVSGRLYRSWEHLVRYQAESLRRLRYELSRRSESGGSR
jgi:hypothetical protein